MRPSISMWVRARAPFAAEAAARRRPLKRSRAGLPAGAEPRVYPRIARRCLLVFGAGALLLVLSRPVRAQVIGEAVELERTGRHDRAAVVYLAVLRGEPTNLAALLGLERVLPPLGRLPELLPLVRRALARDSTNRAFRALEVRTLATLNEPDSAEDAARRWIALAPGDEGPYREWALALADGRRFEEARAVLVAGQRALGGSRAGALAVELADLAARRGDWEDAAREWGRAAAAARARTGAARGRRAAARRRPRSRGCGARPARRGRLRGGAPGARAPGGGLDGARGRAGARQHRARRGADPPGRPRRRHRAARRRGGSRPRGRPRGPGPSARAGPDPPRRAGARRLGPRPRLERRRGGAPRMGGAVSRRLEGRGRRVSRRRAVRRGAARRRRAHRDARVDAAGAARPLPRAGRRAAHAGARRLDRGCSSLTPYGWTTDRRTAAWRSGRAAAPRRAHRGTAGRGP